MVALFATIITADETITLTNDNGGRAITVTTNANVIAISPAARLVSVSNAGTNLVHAAIRVTGAEFAAMVASTNATPITAATSYEFVGGSPIYSLALQTESGSSLVYVGAQR